MVRNIPRNGGAITDLSHRYSFLSILIHRTLGTPDETMWPGVSQLPDYKSDFPKWRTQNLQTLIPQLDKDGIDLLKVSTRLSCLWLLPF